MDGSLSTRCHFSFPLLDTYWIAATLLVAVASCSRETARHAKPDETVEPAKVVGQAPATPAEPDRAKADCTLVWQPYDRQTFAEALQRGEFVIVDLSIDSHSTWHVIERMANKEKKVQTLLCDRRPTLFIADISDQSAARDIDELFTTAISVSRSTLLFPSTSSQKFRDPVVLLDIFPPAEFIAAVEQATQ